MRPPHQRHAERWGTIAELPEDREVCVQAIARAASTLVVLFAEEAPALATDRRRLRGGHLTHEVEDEEAVLAPLADPDRGPSIALVAAKARFHSVDVRSAHVSAESNEGG